MIIQAVSYLRVDKIFELYTVQSLYNTPFYNTDLDTV